MFKDKWTRLRGVALSTGLMFGQQSCAASLYRWSLVWIMTIPAAYLSLNDWVMIREVELAALVQVALEADFRGFSRINDRMGSATTLIVQATRAMAGFAADFRRVFPRSFQPCVRCGNEIMRYRAMTFFTTFRSGELGALNIGWSHDRRRLERGAGNYQGHHHKPNQDKPKSFAAL